MWIVLPNFPTFVSGDASTLRTGDTLLVMLHGLFERGMYTEIVDSIPNWAKNTPHLQIFAPCLPLDRMWSGRHVMDDLHDYLATAECPHRINIVGFSMGGYAVREILSSHPAYFDVAVIIAAGDQPAWLLKTLLWGVMCVIPPRYTSTVEVRTRRIAVYGALDPLLIGSRMSECENVLRYKFSGHQIWSDALRDPRVRDALQGTATPP